MKKSIKTGILLVFGCLVVSNLAFLGITINHSQTLFNQSSTQICTLTTKVDSLEKVVNLNFKEHRDTTIIQIMPQKVHVYLNNK